MFFSILTILCSYIYDQLFTYYGIHVFYMIKDMMYDVLIVNYKVDCSRYMELRTLNNL